ncbi:MAG: ribosome biogenesis GTPase Der [Ruminococcaceae bacterium]|nr:ribosome biogenesis GTPase Der [Oscillospiraceae bacterium]
MSKGVVAVVGRPNVGKSTFFNKITGKRISIVDDTPGVTRDRIYHEITWNGVTMTLIDTGGIEPKTDSNLLRMMRDQAQVAISHADVIIFMCELMTGVTANDRDIATMLKKSGKPVVLCVNKVDTVGALPPEFYEFYELGFEDDPIPVSSLHGTGSGDILDKVVEYLPDDKDGSPSDEGIKVAVIGKPNAGKSSIVNRIAGEERVIVSDMPGTTRDAIDTYIENSYGKYTFIDTAGIRRNAKIEDDIERYSVLRAKMAVEKADVCLIMVDANEGVTAQDERIAGIAHESGKAVIIVINKWDSIEKDNDSVNAFRRKVYEALSYMTYAPLMFVSAKTGQRVEKLFPLINEVYANSGRRITTGVLNDLLNEATNRVQPPSDRGRRLKIYYMTQTGVNPPNFVVFVNSAELFHFSYRRYLENCLRDTFDFTGTPIKMTVKQKGESNK